MKDPFLSIVIPAYNEESRILDTLRKVIEYLHTQSYSWEVVVADDGSTDATSALTQEVADQEPRVRLISIIHRGKGWAVSQGMLAATGEYRFQCDADLFMPIEQLSRFLPPQLEGFDVAIGSREVVGSKRIGEPRGRQLRGRVFNLLVRLLAVSGVKDTQCGFKCYRGQEAQVLFSLQRLHQLPFDVEILMLARQRGLHIVEVPIDWYYQPRGKVRSLKDPLLMIQDLLSIRWRLLRGNYRGITRSSVTSASSHNKEEKQ